MGLRWCFIIPYELCVLWKESIARMTHRDFLNAFWCMVSKSLAWDRGGYWKAGLSEPQLKNRQCTAEHVKAPTKALHRSVWAAEPCLLIFTLFTMVERAVKDTKFTFPPHDIFSSLVSHVKVAARVAKG